MPKPNLDAYKGREQAYVKHCLLEEYLPDWGYKVGRSWDSLVYIDGFAGPWKLQTTDHSDSSFGVALSALENVSNGMFRQGRSLNIQSVLVERSPRAFSLLNQYAINRTRRGFEVSALNGKFAELLPEISRRITAKNPFKFVFLDPKGWSDIPMDKLSPFLKDRSCEVLINLMTRHIIRFLESDDRAESYHRLFGRDTVLEVLRNTPNEQRADVAFQEYCKSLRLLCGFRYVSSAIILEPDKEDTRYYLVYATNHHRGVEVFKEAEVKAARIQDEIRFDTKVKKTGQSEMIFGEVPKSPVALDRWRTYYKLAKRAIVEVLIRAESKRVSYSELFCVAMAFPLVTPGNLHSILKDLGNAVQIVLSGSDKRRKAQPDQDDSVEVVNSAELYVHL